MLPVLRKSLARRRVLALLGAAVLAGPSLARAQGRGGRGGPQGGPEGFDPRAEMSEIPPGSDRGERIVDAHCHFVARAGNSGDFSGAADAAVEAMDRLGIARALILPPPQPPDHRNIYDYDDYVGALRRHPGRFGFLGGGGSLNILIHRGAAAGEIEKAAERILAAGALGFGEITAHHVSYEPGHPYESVPPDGPGFKALADIAARRGVPIDMHLDAVVEDRPVTGFLTQRSPLNPPMLAANIARFEALLAHNRAARFVWAHAGRDPIGERTVELQRSLLDRHPNLFMAISITPRFVPTLPTSPLDPRGALKPAWRDFLTRYPDRFVIASDFFHAASHLKGRRPGPNAMIRKFVNQLPPGAAAKIARENAMRIYKVSA
jgi:hypothetical protein